MHFEFDHTLDHRRNHSTRWQQPDGRDDILGMGTADLDYFCAPCAKEAARRTHSTIAPSLILTMRRSSAGLCSIMAWPSSTAGFAICPAPSALFA